MPTPEQTKEIGPEKTDLFNKAFPVPRGFAELTPVEETALEARLDLIEDKIDNLTAKLELIFGKSILMKGRFIEL